MGWLQKSLSHCLTGAGPSRPANAAPTTVRCCACPTCPRVTNNTVRAKEPTKRKEGDSGTSANLHKNLMVAESAVRNGGGGDRQGEDGEAEDVALGGIRVHPVLMEGANARVTVLRCVAVNAGKCPHVTCTYVRDADSHELRRHVSHRAHAGGDVALYALARAEITHLGVALSGRVW